MDATNLCEAVQTFRKRQADATSHAMQKAALQILCGIDLDAVLAGSGERRKAAVLHIARHMERERLKGVRGHWSYDINRHIALKQALDRVMGAEERKRGPAQRPKRKRRPRAPQ